MTLSDISLVKFEEEHIPLYTKFNNLYADQTNNGDILTVEEVKDIQQKPNSNESSTFIIIYQSQQVGDVNLFVNDNVGEINVLVAKNQRCGIAFKAVCLIIKHGLTIGINDFMVKIGTENWKSLKLFGKLGFVEKSRSQVFNEIELVCRVDENWVLKIGDF